MIELKEFQNKSFNSIDDAHRFLIENKKLVIAAKKSTVKWCDNISLYSTDKDVKTTADKADDNSVIDDINVINVVAVGNACNYFDSHRDVSISGSWNRTAKNAKGGLHLQEHKMTFEKLISDNVKYKVENKTWKELGYDYEGSTDCLVMYSEVERETNPFMFSKYLNRKIKNHSAGLIYVNVVLCVNNNADWAKEEKENWDKYYPNVINKDELDEVS